MKYRSVAILALTALAAAAAPASAAPRPPLPPSPFVLPVPPDVKHLVPIPKTQLFFAPDGDADLVFFDGYWWLLRDGRWLRSRDYRREFSAVPPAYVPAPLRTLRPDFRRRYRHERPIPYGDWRRDHWRREWDGERRDDWERRGDERGDGDRGRHEGRDRGKHGGKGRGGNEGDERRGEDRDRGGRN